MFSLNDVNVTNGGTGVSHPVPDAPLDPETLSWMTAFPPLLAILGSVLSSVLLDILGRWYFWQMTMKIHERVCRRLSIILAGTILGLSFILIFVADFLSSSQHLILAGKMKKQSQKYRLQIYKSTTFRTGNQWIRCWTWGTCYSNLCCRGDL